MDKYKQQIEEILTAHRNGVAFHLDGKHELPAGAKFLSQQATAEALVELIQTAQLEVIGEDDPKPDDERSRILHIPETRNQLRAEQRQRILK